MLCVSGGGFPPIPKKISTCKLMLGLSLSITRFIPEYMPPFIVSTGSGPSILPTGHVEDIETPPTPGRTRGIASREDDILQASALAAEHHDAV